MRPEDSLHVYQMVLAEDSMNYSANLVLAAYYLNQAVKMDKELEGLPTTDPSNQNILQKRNELLKEAFPFFNRLVHIDANNQDFAQRIWAICYHLEREDEPGFRDLFFKLVEAKK